MIRVGHGRCVNTSQGPDGHHGAERSRLVVRLACRHHRERRSERALGAEAGPSPSANHAQAPTAKPAGDLRRVAGSNLFAQGHLRRGPNAPANRLGRVRQANHGHAPGFPNGMDNGGNGGGGVRQPALRRRRWQDLLQNIANGVAPEMEGATCLGDVLAAHGYHAVLMTGADVIRRQGHIPRIARLR